MPVNNQNTQQPKKVPITISGYSQAVQDMMRAKHPDYDQVMNQKMQERIRADCHTLSFSQQEYMVHASVTIS